MVDRQDSWHPCRSHIGTLKFIMIWGKVLHLLSDSVNTSLKALTIMERWISTLININACLFPSSIKSTFVASIAVLRASSATTSTDASVGSELILALGVFTTHMITCLAFVDIDAFVSPVELESVSASTFVRA